jgi:uncharacterized caspase-like protein
MKHYSYNRLLPTVSSVLAKTALVLAIGAALCPLSAQAPVDLRIALVIGNAAYAGAAALANPANDAKAMGAALKAVGFEVVAVQDASRVQMAAAIERVRAGLKGKKGIAMLYYAGHGLQVDWRNFMVPVDAQLAKAADVAAQTIDLAQVMDAFKSAETRMNIVVLDACRDNPFADGDNKVATGKGLAQFDAPPGTFLAYATAPGNVAEDGAVQGADGKAGNGLYTSFLLQELQKPAAKIEDVFKRTRWAVRNASSGRQIPWESTSLEEDFFFYKPSAASLAPEELEKQFNLQLERWNKIQSSSDLSLLQAFLNDYPSGAFSELAQFKFNRLQREAFKAAAEKAEAQRIALEKSALAQAAIERKAAADKSAAEQARLAAAEQAAKAKLAKAEAESAARIAAASTPVQAVLRPAVDGKLMASTITPLERNWRVGMRATYNENSWATKKDEELRYRVSKINGDTVELNQGKVVWDLMGNLLANRNGSYSAPRQFYPAELQVGKRWNTRVSRERTDGVEDVWDINVRVVGRETIEVPAGKFDTYVIKAEGWRKQNTYQQRREWTIWVAPGVPFDIAREQTVRNNGRMSDQLVTKLTSLGM